MIFEKKQVNEAYTFDKAKELIGRTKLLHLALENFQNFPIQDKKCKYLWLHSLQ
jgi:hypothetical protein